jgi:hypothetical protein
MITPVVDDLKVVIPPGKATNYNDVAAGFVKAVESALSM